MPIFIDEHKNIFTIHTLHTTYQFMADQYGFLLHLYYGSNIKDETMEHLILPIDRGFSGNPHEAGKDRRYSLDTLPLEYPTEGIGDFRFSALHVVNHDGSRIADLKYQSFQIYSGKYSIPGQPALYDEFGKDAETLEICLADKVTGLVVKLLYGVFAKQDIITRAAIIYNSGRKAISLHRIQSVSLDLPYGSWQVIHFHGRHNMERMAEQTALPHGITLFGSKRGTSSHQHNPFLVLCNEQTNEFSGECYGINLVYSGGFLAGIEYDQTNLTRISMGIDDDGFEWNLAPKQSFSTPEAVMSYSQTGFSTLSHHYHTVYLEHLIRGKFKDSRSPIVINNWEATYFDFNEDKLLMIAKEAARLGIEMLVMDDGWFGKRNSDTCSLGDWNVNLDKLPRGLKALVDDINALGMKFGIWLEPEMISEDSNLYRIHPDWAIQVPGRSPTRSREQLVLDMSHEDVRDYLYQSISNILLSANIEYVKWDMNRSISDRFSAYLAPEMQGEFKHRYVLGVYDLLERLTKRFPDVLFEGCSGGGGRFDPAMLYYHPLIWCSDNTDAAERLKIQYGTSFAYPTKTVSSHVSAVPNHQTGRCISLHTRGVVAMSGNFGYELDLTALSDAEKKTIVEQIKDFKKYQHILHHGLYYRLSNPYQQPFAAWMMVLPDRCAALFHLTVSQAEANAPHIHVKLAGLDRNRLYTIEQVCEGETQDMKFLPNLLLAKKYSGELLMSVGLVFPYPQKEYFSLQLYLN